MTADIVNLNKARKKKARAERATQAQENRVRFGQTKAERSKAAAERERIARELEGARRIGPATDDGGDGA